MSNGYGRYVRRISTHAPDSDTAVTEIVAGLKDVHLSAVVLYVSPKYDLHMIGHALQLAFEDAIVVGCSTAGEIGAAGYADESIVAIAYPSENFFASATLLRDLDQINFRKVSAEVLSLRNDVMANRPDWTSEFASLLIDGTSQREDTLVSAIMPSLGTTQLFGGSAGNGLNFVDTRLLYRGEVLDAGAILMLVRTRCSVRVFRFDNFIPSETRMVVTEADANERIVKSINAEPAAREYARLVGKDPDQLTPFIFAAHPVVVRVGGQHHVRAIQKVDETGYLRFFSAVDEGLVLTVATGDDIADHLEHSLQSLRIEKEPDAIIICDCILRRLDAEQSQSINQVSRILSQHGVYGFSTYGEQHNSLHVNQTFTGVAIYPPDTAA